MKWELQNKSDNYTRAPMSFVEDNNLMGELLDTFERVHKMFKIDRLWLTFDEKLIINLQVKNKPRRKVPLHESFKINFVVVKDV